MTYYIEYIFIENFIIDFLLVYITGSLLKKDIKPVRILIAATIGAFYVLAIAITNEGFLSTAIVKLSVSLLMLTVAYNPAGIISYIKLVLCFYIVSLLLVGVLIGINYFLNSNQVTIKLILETAFFVIVILKIVFTEIKKKESQSKYMREINIELKNKKVKVKGLIDTGNELSDTLTGKPVIIVEKESVYKLLSENIREKINKFYFEKGKNIIEILSAVQEGINLRIIKYNTISNKDENMLAIVPDRVWLISDKKKKFTLEVLIGIYPEKFSNENEYQALLHKQLLEWESEI